MIFGLPPLIVATVALGVYALKIDQVRVTGLQTLSAQSVVKQSGLRPGERILWVRLSSATRLVEQLPSVADAVVERKLPSTVVIRVRERLPLVRLDSAPEFVSDHTGRLFAADTAVVPTLSGWKTKAKAGAELDSITRYVLRAFDRFPREFAKRVQQIKVGPPLVMVLDNGTEVRFGRLEELDDKAAAAHAVLREEGYKPLAYVDVRSATVPVVRDKAPATPDPNASPGASPTPLPSR